MHTNPATRLTTAHGVLTAALAACGIPAGPRRPLPSTPTPILRDAPNGDRAAVVRLLTGEIAWGFGPSDAIASDRAAHNARAVAGVPA